VRDSARYSVPLAAQADARLVAVVAGLAATTMLFASLTSAYLVRRSFPDWSPETARWPAPLAGLGLLASMAIEGAVRSYGLRRELLLKVLFASTSAYLAAALLILVSRGGSIDLSAPHHAFVILLLSLHVVHALIAVAFAAATPAWRSPGADPGGLRLARLVTHFLTALLFAILFLLFVLR